LTEQIDEVNELILRGRMKWEEGRNSSNERERQETLDKTHEKRRSVKRR
jgi:hypothetical protein